VSRPAKQYVLIAAVAVVILAGAAALLLTRFSEPDLPVYGTLPDLSLVDQDGQNFRLAATRGKVVVLGLIYTHCPDVCPVITGKMKAVQARLKSAGLEDAVVFLTVTFDPERDTPPVLRRYAEAYELDLTNWRLLTGPADAIEGLTDLLGFYTERTYVAEQPAAAGSPDVRPDTPYFITHSDRFFIVDRKGQIRASLPGSRTDVDQALRIIQRLAAKTSP
jgi:protein SCO1/2